MEFSKTPQRSAFQKNMIKEMEGQVFRRVRINMSALASALRERSLGQTFHVDEGTFQQ